MHALRTDLPAAGAKAADPVLVSFVVRSMGRPELRNTLESIARQDHDAIEVVIVDATGGRHPPLPDIAWPAGHVVRLVSRGEPLKRPQAAMLGLQSVRGDWFTFLDDDDTCDPTHVSALLDAALSHPRALVVYGCGRLCDDEGRVQQVFGRPFNRALMHYGPLFYWQSAIISARVRDLGCGFDAALDVCEDRDFLAQIAEHGDFLFVPTLATFSYRPDLGTSGTGQGANRNAARVARFENLLRAKWAGSGIYHNERAANLCRSGVRAFFDGDLVRSQLAFERVIAEYPDDPNAVHGLARVACVRGDLLEAERAARRAIEINPQAAEYRATLDEILVAAGRAVRRDAAPLSRTSPCPCGSGRRYKACCGRIDAVVTSQASVGPVADALVDAVERSLRRGEATVAQALLASVTSDEDCSRLRLVVAARIELALSRPEAAFALLQRAAAQGMDVEVGSMLDDCCAQLAQRERHASLWTMIARLCAGPAATRTRNGGDDHSILRIAVPQDASIDALRRVEALHALLDASARVERIDMTSNAARPRAALVTLEAEDPGSWLEHEPAPERVVVHLGRDAPEALLRCLARVQQCWPSAMLEFTAPHAGIASAISNAPIEYPWIDEAFFEMPLPVERSPLVVGLQGPASDDHDHPDDGMFYRALIADGLRVALSRTPALQRAFDDDGAAARPALLGAEASLAGLDIVVVRGDPRRPGWADARVLEAMAAGRPVVALPSSLGAREWIVEGLTGFLVGSDDAARACIARLAATPSLRKSIGDAARRAARDIVRTQRLRARANYLGVSLNV